MKCPICNGKGYVYNALGSFNEDCGHCQGTGTVRVEGEPMTNEAWLRTLTTEQLAEFLYDIAYFDNWSDAIMNDSLINETAVEDAIEKWLKQPHTKN